MNLRYPGDDGRNGQAKARLTRTGIARRRPGSGHGETNTASRAPVYRGETRQVKSDSRKKLCKVQIKADPNAVQWKEPAEGRIGPSRCEFAVACLNWLAGGGG